MQLMKTQVERVTIFDRLLGGTLQPDTLLDALVTRQLQIHLYCPPPHLRCYKDFLIYIITTCCLKYYVLINIFY